MLQVTGRVTAQKFIDFINSEFKRLEINSYRVVKCERTFYTRDQYEGGAARLIITVMNISCNASFHFNCFYSLSQYEYYIKNGWNLYIKFNNGYVLSDIEIEVKK